jgi:hypothetical protein
MLFGFINRVSSAAQVKEGLDLSTQRTRAIAQRVATATLGNQSGFALPQGAAPAAPVNLEDEMTSLADEQIRFEAMAKMLEGTYLRIRTSIKER